MWKQLIGYDRAKGRERFEVLVADYATWSNWKRAFLVFCVLLGIVVLPYANYSRGVITVGWRSIGLSRAVSLAEDPLLFHSIFAFSEILLLVSLSGLIKLHLAYRASR
jgi:hypothetical protein